MAGAGNKRKPQSVVSEPSIAAEPALAPNPKRRRPRRVSQESDNSHLESGNSSDPPYVTKPETETRIPAQTPMQMLKQEPLEMMQPKTEYRDDMNNDEQVEDLTIEDEEDDDSYMAKPGTSHGDNSMGKHRV